MNSSKIQPANTKTPTIDKKAEKRPIPNKKILKTQVHTNPTTYQYDSDDNEYDDMSEMVDLGFD